jgi:3',5'-cyclic AMP phosphodiesterase CpdA
MVGRAPDIGAFEGGRVTLVHLTDLHLLAPVGDAIYVGVSYEPRLWDVDSYLAGIAASLPPGVSPDALIITGDIVDLASESSTYTTPLGSASRAQWDDTYLGYRAFKALCEQWFPNAPVFATVGNHDYREHPLYPWTWSDDQGISDAFLEELPYAPVEILPLGASLGIQTENDITLVMLNSGHDAIASSQLQQTELYPYLLEYALNGEHVIDVLHDIPPPNSVGQYVGMFAYGSGLGDEQLDVLGQYMALHPSSTYIIACHHPIVYDRMTIAYNIGEILDLCRQYPVSYVLSGHAHQPFEIEVQWGEEKETIFEIAGAAMSGQFALLFVPLGNVAEYDITYAHST